MSIVNIFKQINIFNSLKAEELEKLENISTIINYNANEVLFTRGDTSDNIFILTDGIVSVYKHNSKGDEIVIGYFHKYAFLAEPAILKHIPLPSTARFHTDGSILKIPLKNFEELLMIYPEFSHGVIMSLLDKIQLLQQNIHFNLASNSKEKVLNFYAQNTKLAHDLKRYEIASLLGITQETLSRVINQLLKEKQLVQRNSILLVPENK